MKVLSSLLLLLCCLLIASAAPAAATSSAPLKLLQPPPQASGPGHSAAQAPPATRLRDIEGPVEVPMPLEDLLLYATLGLATLAALALLCRWLVKRPEKAVPTIPPGMRARDELLRARSLMTEGQVLLYLDRLSEILRHYIEARFTLQTTRQTTREFFATLSRNLSGHITLAPFSKELRDCLERCDMAKFAHQSTSLDTLREMEDLVNNFIIRTEHRPDENTRERR